MMERQEKLARLEKIGKETDTSIEETEFELQSSDSIPDVSKEAKEYKTKIFALETDVEKSALTPSSLKRNYLKCSDKFQISDSNITVVNLKIVQHNV